jgi:hypothetical protein
MSASLLLGLLTTLAPSADPPPASCGWLYEPAFFLDKELRGVPRPYLPQAGDIILLCDDRLEWRIAHNLAKTGKPHHSAVVVQRADGSFATLQAGAYHAKPSEVGITDLDENLSFEASRTGRRERDIWIRCRKSSLTPDQSAALTQYAEESAGRRFARGRMLLIMTPIRAKGPLRTAWIGGTDLNQIGFFCSEMVTTSLAAAGVLDPEFARPSATFPRDLFFGTSHNYFVARGLKSLNDCWDPPARWTSMPGGPSPAPSNNR